MNAHTILMGIAALCLLLAAIGRPATSPLSLGWLGMFFWALSQLVSQ